MTLVIIQPGVSWGTIRNALNTNTGEIETRLSAIESIAYVRSGNGPPTNAQFNDGDYYIDDSSYDLYKKAAGVWALQTSLKGPAGFTSRGVWSTTVSYVATDAVIHRGSTWLSLRNNLNVEPNQTNTSDWRLIATGLYNAGIWTSGNNYRFNDVVKHNGSLYIANSDITNSTTAPDASTSWALVVSKGDQGIQGVKGDTGPPGPIGQFQENGANVTVRSTADFRKNIRATDDSAATVTRIDVDLHDLHRFFFPDPIVSVRNSGPEPIFRAGSYDRWTVEVAPDGNAPVGDSLVLDLKRLSGGTTTAIASLTLAAGAKKVAATGLSLALLAEDTVFVTATPGAATTTGASKLMVKARQVY